MVAERRRAFARSAVARSANRGTAVRARSTPTTAPMAGPKEEPVEDEPEELEIEPNPFMDPQPRPEYDWDAIKECYMQGRGPKDVARLMDVPLNTLKGRIRRECWAHERREVDA